MNTVRHRIKRVTFEGGINKFEYTGEPITPKVIPECEYLCADLEERKDYEVSYENNIEPGTATVVVTGLGDHQSVVRKTFTIVKAEEEPDEDPSEEPEQVTSEVKLSNTVYTYNGKVRKPSVTVSAGGTVLRKGFKAKWAGRSTQITGYQLQYSTSSKFKKYKNVWITKHSTVTKKVKKLKAKKRYYLRIRTYKIVNGTKYYSSWSKKKSVKTK